MNKYNIGDKVRINNKRGAGWNCDGNMDKWMGKIMTIRSIFTSTSYKMVEDVRENDGYGWAWGEDDFTLVIESHKILITADGTTTLARLYDGEKVVKTATAKCNPEDTYDFNVGAKLAMDRLMGVEKKAEAKKEPPKPSFVEGGYAKIIKNQSGYLFKTGVIVKLDHLYSTSKKEWQAFSLDNQAWKIIPESDMTPCEAPKAKAEPPKAEPVKQEPVKLYCLADKNFTFHDEKAFTKGKVYEIDSNGEIKLEDGNSYLFCTYESFKSRNPDYAACLIPLVRRSAKVGEWVYVINDTHEYGGKSFKKGEIIKITHFGCMPSITALYGGYFGFHDDEYLILDGYQPEPATIPAEPPKQPEKPANLVDRDAKVGEKIYINKAEGTNGAYKNGDICEVVRENNAFIGDVYIKTPTGKTVPYSCSEGEGTAYVNRSEYLVVEEKPKYYNGKVICTNKKYPGSATVSDFTVGKTYNIIDGCITSDDGYISDHYVSIECLCQGMGSTFIPAVD